MALLPALAIASTFTLSLSSCEKEDIVAQASVLDTNDQPATIDGNTLYAFVDQQGTTRTEIANYESEQYVCKIEDDKITVLATANNESNVYTFESKDGTKAFTNISQEQLDLNDVEQLFGVYPANEAITIKNGSLYTTLPTTQIWQKGCFAPGVCPMVATKDGPFDASNIPEIRFHATCGILNFRFTCNEEVSISSIAINSTSGISGKFKYDEKTGIYEYAGDKQALDKTVTLNCGSGVALDASTSTDFAIVLPTGKYEDFSFTLYTTDFRYRTYSINNGKSFTVNKAAFTNISMKVSDFQPRYQVVEEETFNYNTVVKKMLKPEEGRDISKIFTFAYTMGVTRYPSDYDRRTRLYKAIKLNYLSKTPEGNDAWLSGRIFFSCNKNGVILAPEHTVLCSHYTIGSNAEAPSSETTYTFDIGMVLHKGLVVSPDYLGYGNTSEYVHPYMCAEQTAMNNLDMVRATRQYLEDQNIDMTKANSNMYLLGYSQGGFSTLATQKYINTGSDELKAEFPLKNTYCGAGVYSPWIWLSNNYGGSTNYPGGVVLLIKGMKYTFPDIMTHNLEDYFTYSINNSNVMSLVESKTVRIDDIATAVKSAVGVSTSAETVDMSLILSSGALNQENVLYREIQEAMMRSELTNGWKPTTPVNFFHYSKDESVSINQYNLAKSELNVSGITHWGEVDIAADNWALAWIIEKNLNDHRTYAGLYYARCLGGEYMKVYTK
jgi:hypothetical protein